MQSFLKVLLKQLLVIKFYPNHKWTDPNTILMLPIQENDIYMPLTPNVAWVFQHINATMPLTLLVPRGGGLTGPPLHKISLFAPIRSKLNTDSSGLFLKNVQGPF